MQLGINEEIQAQTLKVRVVESDLMKARLWLRVM